MENNNIDIKDFFKKNILSTRTVIALMSCMILILLFYIAGSKAINELNFQKFIDESTVAVTSSLETTVKADETTTSQKMKIDINTDNVSVLCQLPGIGQSKAQLILEYRKRNGDFQKIEELMKVKGIGETTFNNLKDYIYINKNQ